MGDAVYSAIATAQSGFVEAPAGCGKTEAIVRTVGAFCRDTQLILTHTHAGVDALKRRFRDHGVASSKYHVDTIAGWCWGWVRNYPSRGGYPGSTDIAVWNDVYSAMTVLLECDFVKIGILNSYSGLIVDEYQDCTLPMHRLVVTLKAILPCRVLGDDLQGIFGFGKEKLVSWSDVRDAFINDLGVLETPHRWIKAGNEKLGRWLVEARSEFRQDREPQYRNSPIFRETISYRDLGKRLINLTHKREGRICVIGPKARPLPAGLETTLVNQGYRVLEANELSALRELVIALSDGKPHEKADAAVRFIGRAHGGLSGNVQSFLEKLAKGEPQRPKLPARKELCAKHPSGTTPQLVADMITYVTDMDGVSCKLRESVSGLKCILEEHFETGNDVKALYALEIAKRKHQSRSHVYRSIGTTLLVKGLEFDHVVVLRDANWQKNWGGFKDLYVALTRGAKSATLIKMAD